MSIDRYGWEELAIEARDGLALPALRHRAPRPRGVVVCLHGASAWGDTFRLPRGESLADTLVAHGYDVWLPEWRGSMHVTPRLAPFASGMDIAARDDIPAIVEAVRRETPSELPIHIVAHCLGSAVLNMAIGGGHLDRALLGSDARVLCSTIGLFFAVPWDGQVKATDRLLQRAVAQHPKTAFLDPGAAPGQPGAWPAAIESAYQLWPDALLPPGAGREDGNELYRRVSFMYGRPYLADEVADAIHRDELPAQFGAMDLGIYLHGTECIRRGYAAPLSTRSGAEAPFPTTYLRRERFAPFDLTYFGGAHNELWHRDSVDRMYEWLRRPGGPRRVRKTIFQNFGHQDLYWGRRAADEVFPFVLRTLDVDAAASAIESKTVRLRLGRGRSAQPQGCRPDFPMGD